MHNQFSIQKRDLVEYERIRCYRNLLSREVVFVTIILIFLHFSSSVESVPSPKTVKNSTSVLNSKIRTFLKSHCSMQNETLEQEEFESFMNCSPSHGAGIVKRLRSIPEYKSNNTEKWMKESRRVILTECQIWPQDKRCQQKAFMLIEKCFDADQKFIFYFNFALTDIICQDEGGKEIFLNFWHSGGDLCLVSHLKSLRSNFADCLRDTTTTSSAIVIRNFDNVLQCFRATFDEDCKGNEMNQMLNEIMADIRRVYRDTSKMSSSRAAKSNTFLVILPVITMLLYLK